MKNSLASILLVVGIIAGSGVGYSLAPYKSLSVTTTTTDFVTSVITISNTSSSTSCSATGGIGCPHYFNETYLITINYSGAWGLSYQGYLLSDSSLVEAGNFFGHGSTNETITTSGTDTSGVKTCVQAQKLDSSDSMLVVNFNSPQLTNKTSLPYGTASICLAVVIA